MLLKCLLLQKWFRIPSDPELENQINDRISFKKFLGLPLDKPSSFRARGLSRPAADYSTFQGLATVFLSSGFFNFFTLKIGLSMS